MRTIKEKRDFMKSPIGDTDIKATSDIVHGIPQPPFQKAVDAKSLFVDLLIISADTAPKADYYTCTRNRISRRSYSDEPLSLFELSFLLWCTQGLKKVIGGYYRYLPDGSGRNYLRPVPTAGNAYETYLAIGNVSDVQPGVWRYLPLTHQLVFIKSVEKLPQRISDIFTNPSQNQSYASKAAVVFFWACVPYRGEWVFKESHKNMLLELGHISHQLYLATEALECGCCAIGGYYQQKADELIGVDGEDEFTVLCASIGHVTPEEKNRMDKLPDARDNPEFYSKRNSP